MIFLAPVAFERRVEHLAEPMDDHRLLHLREDAVVDLAVVVGRFRRRGERAARHQDDATAELLDRGALLLVGRDDVLDGMLFVRRKMISAGTARDHVALGGGLYRAAD